MGAQAAKVVLDTNVLVSALLWQGAVKDIFILAKTGQVRICASREILQEFQSVLEYPKFATRLALIDKTPKTVVDEFLEIVDFYPVEVLSGTIIKEDPSDDAVLACAVASRADFIVSGDRHLKRLSAFRGIPILSPAEFLKLF